MKNSNCILILSLMSLETGAEKEIELDACAGRIDAFDPEGTVVITRIRTKESK